MRNIPAVLALLLFTLFGAILRLVNISPFKIYPDTYQSLIVAQNILDYHQVIGKLGETGVVYPYFLMWTRPGFPLLINLFSAVIPDPVLSARLIVLGAGILAIPVSFLLVRKIFSSDLAGLSAALLMALSFNHTVWGGFIYTETLGVLLILLILWRTYAAFDNPAKLADWQDLLIGLLLSAAFFTRYEYLVILIPLLVLIIQKSQNALIRIINILVSFAFVSSLVFKWLYPISGFFRQLADQLDRFLYTAAAGLILLLVIIISRSLLKKLNIPFGLILSKASMVEDWLDCRVLPIGHSGKSNCLLR